MILGDATGEMGKYSWNSSLLRTVNSWYADDSAFANMSQPWLGRGGFLTSGALAGQFALDKRAGGGDRQIGFRLALAPSN